MTPIDITTPCCWACAPDYQRMMLCSICGNKRCPHANDHDNACTGSNAVRQKGSAYENVADPSDPSTWSADLKKAPGEA